MASQTGLAERERPTSRLIGYNLRRGGTLGFYSDTQIAAATNIDDLIANVNAAVVHAQYDNEKLQVIKALRFGKANGDLSDTRVQGVATKEALVDLTFVADDADDSHLGSHMVG